MAIPRRRNLKVMQRRIQTAMAVRTGLVRSRSEHAHRDVSTICLLVGPYRNLTTLTVGVLALHPQVQVLNHAGIRTFGYSTVDFIADSAAADRWKQYATWLSRDGKRGHFGGSILRSHAFDGPQLRDRYRERYGELKIKSGFQSLVWKESMRVTNRLRENDRAVGLLSELDELRLLLPVRSPLDCVMSNLRTGHAKHIDGPGASFTSTLRGILEAYSWFDQLAERFPARCMWFTEADVASDPELLDRLAHFLNIGVDKRWVEDSRATMIVSRATYSHEPEHIAEFHRALDDSFNESSRLGAALRSMVPAP